jgi:hypothetical protein
MLVKEYRLMFFENVVLSKIFRPRRDKVMGQEEVS